MLVHLKRLTLKHTLFHLQRVCAFAILLLNVVFCHNALSNQQRQPPPQATKVQVFFVEIKDKNNQVLAFEKGGQYYHVGIEVFGRTYEAHPFWGVRETNAPTDLGPLAIALEHTIQIPPKEMHKRVKSELGKKFYLYSDWKDRSTTQCSKFVAQLLSVEPAENVDGKKTFSPDSLFRLLKAQGFAEKRICSRLFLN